MLRTPSPPSLPSHSANPASPPQMNMLWNSQIAGTCVVFPQWHIHTPLGMFLSCLLIVGISIAYARLLHYIRLRDRRTAAGGGGGGGGYEYAPALPYAAEEGTAFHSVQFGRLSLPNLGASREHSPVSMSPPPTMGQHRFPPSVPVRWGIKVRLVRAALYAVTVAVSFFVRFPRPSSGDWLC